MSNLDKQVKQVFFLLALVVICFFVLKELYIFLPGFLGAVTLYILFRGYYFQLIYSYKWNKGFTASLFLAICFFLIVFLGYVIYSLLADQVAPFFNDPVKFMQYAKKAIFDMQLNSGIQFFSEKTIDELQKDIIKIVPNLVNDTLNLLANFAMMLFVLYFMFVQGKQMESYLERIIPLKLSNLHLMVLETKRLVRVNAIGIPLISVVQGITATIGYIIFNVEDYLLWGTVTGLFAFFPIIGTMVVWIPIVVFMYYYGHTWQAIGLGIYSLVLTGNIDYLTRVTFLKKIGHIHPMVTVMGVLVGLKLFGFIGLIFGPLLINYIILLVRIYNHEFMIKNDLLSEQPN